MSQKFEFDRIKPAFINGGLRAFVQTVLPTIYDDSLSYYELLNKVVKHLNNVVSDVATLNTNQENFMSAVTAFINTYAIDTYDIDIANPLIPSNLQLSEDETTALYDAVNNNKIVRVFVNNGFTGTAYCCYYCTIDNSIVDAETGKHKNDLYFMGYNYRQVASPVTSIQWKIIKIEPTGKITIFDNVNAVTKKYVDDLVFDTATGLGQRIDNVNANTPYKVYFNVYPDPENGSHYIANCDLTPLTVSMLNEGGRSVDCFIINKSAVDGFVISTIKANTVVFTQNKVIATFPNIISNNQSSVTRERGYDVIYGATNADEWTLQLPGKVTGKVDFYVELLDGNQIRLASYSHTPSELIEMFRDFDGFTPCTVYIHTSATNNNVTTYSNTKTPAFVKILSTSDTDVVIARIEYDELVNSANSPVVTHYAIMGSQIVNRWSITMDVFEYSASGGALPSGGNVGDFLVKTATGAGWQTVPNAESEAF